MLKIPKLTPQQRHRLAKFLFDSQILPSMQAAKKATATDYKCKDIFLKSKHIIDSYGLFNINIIQDIADLYIIENTKETHKKAELSNCGADLITDKSNCTHKKELSLIMEVTENSTAANQTHKKARGKQKTPTMEHHRVRLPSDMLKQLKALDGTVSQHIRQAIDQYLNSLVVSSKIN